MPAPLRLSDDRRYLAAPDGTPFYFVADTAWSIVFRGTPDQLPDQLCLAYFPRVVGRPVVDGLSPGEWPAAWLDPLTGARHEIGLAEPALDLAYRPPAHPSGEDWLLVLARAAPPAG